MDKIPLQLLLVEDDEDDYLLTCDLLKEVSTFDFKTNWATNFSAAKAAISEKPFDICLVDYQLGDHTGLEFLQEAVADGFRAPVILLTGQNSHAIDLEAMKAGAADYLIKGKIDAALLERSIRYAIERRRTERALEESAERERALIKNAPDVICTIDANGIFVSVSPASFKIWGYYPEELIGHPYRNLVIPEDILKSEEAVRKVASGEEITDFENCYRHKNGTIVHLIWTAHWLESEQLMFTVAHDITKRKQTEAALQESELRYRLLFENNPNATWIWDVETFEFLAVNEEAIRLLGYSRQEFQKLTIRELRPPEDLPLFLDYIAQTEAGVEKFQSMRLQKKDGTIIETELALQTITFLGRRGRLTLVTDITERRQAERDLQESELRYRLLFENSPNPIWIYDIETSEFIVVNEEATRHYGYSHEEFQKLTLKDLRPPEDALLLQRYSILANAGVDKLFSVRHQKKDGTIIEVEISIQPISFIGRRARLAMISDVTERRQAEKELWESQQLLKLVIDTLPQAVWWKDRSGTYMGANQFLANVAGFDSPEQIIGLSDYDMPWMKEESDLYRRDDRHVMESGVANLNILETQLQSDGKQTIINTNKVPLRNTDGEIVGVLGTFADITEQKRADAALRESEYKLRTLLESMREGLLQVDKEDRIVFVNDCFCDMVEFSSEELMGTNWTRLMFDDDGHNLVEQANERRRDGISDSYELCLRKKSGEMLWVIVGGAPVLDSEGVITGSLGVFTDITIRKLAEEQLIHDAFHDGLTGLANRALFHDHLQMTIERTKRDRQEMFAVLFLDFDRFKVINDSLGHAEGDNLLKQIARRLENSLRTGDLVARLGGDEFTVLLNRINDSLVALRVAERIQKNLQKPFEIGGGEIFISASIGIALSTTGHEKAEDMLRDADIAMYRAKSRGKAQHQVFDRAMHEQASNQLRLETEMRQALEREEFLLHYQPIFNLKTKQLVGFEALVRWNHPERGIIPPFEFIPAAEENGLILPLGNWILHESCRQLQSWHQCNPATLPLTVSVNLSSKQFLQPDLAEQIAAALEKTRLNPRRLKLEITESHIMENSETAEKTMSKLRKLGVGLSLDDFGTGYSSLSYLHRLPVNYLKIDRSFVTRMIHSEENSEIVHTIIKLAQNLKMKVVAEGIETGEQLAQLESLNCEYGQGYFFAKPMDARMAEMFIANSLKS